MGNSSTGGLSPLADMRCKLTAAEKRIEELEAVLEAGLADLETQPAVGRSIDYANGFRRGAQCQRMKLRAAISAAQECDCGDPANCDDWDLRHPTAAAQEGE